MATAPKADDLGRTEPRGLLGVRASDDVAEAVVDAGARPIDKQIAWNRHDDPSEARAHRSRERRPTAHEPNVRLNERPPYRRKPRPREKRAETQHKSACPGFR